MSPALRSRHAYTPRDTRLGRVRRAAGYIYILFIIVAAAMNASVAACREGGRRSNEPQERRAAKIAAGTDPSTRRRPIWRHFLRRRSCGPRRPLPPPAFLPGRPRRARRAGAWLCDPTGAPTAANEEGTQLAHAYRSPAPSRGPTTSLLLGAYWSFSRLREKKKRLTVRNVAALLSRQRPMARKGALLEAAACLACLHACGAFVAPHVSLRVSAGMPVSGARS